MALSSRQKTVERSSKSFVRELTSLFGPIEHKEHQNWFNTFHFSNDREIYSKLVQLNSDISNGLAFDKTTVAIFIGNGYLLSILPLISADTILICDIDHNLLN